MEALLLFSHHNKGLKKSYKIVYNCIYYGKCIIRHNGNVLRWINMGPRQAWHIIILQKINLKKNDQDFTLCFSPFCLLRKEACHNMEIFWNSALLSDGVVHLYMRHACLSCWPNESECKGQDNTVRWMDFFSFGWLPRLTNALVSHWFARSHDHFTFFEYITSTHWFFKNPL